MYIPFLAPIGIGNMWRVRVVRVRGISPSISDVGGAAEAFLRRGGGAARVPERAGGARRVLDVREPHIPFTVQPCPIG